MQEPDLNALRVDFEGTAELIIAAGLSLRSGNLAPEFDEAVSRYQSVRAKFEKFQKLFNLPDATRIADLEKFSVISGQIQLIRYSFSNGRPPDLSLELLQSFNELLTLNVGDAIQAALAISSLSNSFSILTDEEYENKREEARRFFKNNLVNAAGRGALSIPPIILVDDEVEDAATNSGPFITAQISPYYEVQGIPTQQLFPEAKFTSINQHSISSQTLEGDNKLEITIDDQQNVIADTILGNDSYLINSDLSDSDLTDSDLTDTIADINVEINEVEPLVELVDVPSRPPNVFEDYIAALREKKVLPQLNANVGEAEATTDGSGLKTVDSSQETNEKFLSLSQSVVQEAASRPVLTYNAALALEENATQSLIPSWILKIAILGRRIDTSDGILAHSLKEIIDANDYSEFEENHISAPDRARALSIMLAGSLLRPSLIAPSSGSKTLLNSLRYVGGAMHDLTVEIVNGSEKLRSINFSTVRQMIAEQRSEATPVDLQAEAKRWVDNIEQSSINYAEARKIRRAWLVQGGLLEAIIRNPLANDTSGVEQLTDLLNRVDENFIDRKINEADSRTNKNRIEGNARRQLHETVKDAVDLAWRWLGATAHDQNHQGFAITQLQELELHVREIVPRIKRELKEIELKSTPILLAALHCYKDSIEGVLEIFDRPPDAVEDDEYLLQSGDILQTFVTLPSEQADPSPILDICEMVQAFEQPLLNPEEAFRFRLSKGNFKAANLIVESLYKNDETSALRLKDEVVALLQERRESVRVQAKSTRVQVERAFTQHIITEDERDAFESRVSQVLDSIGVSDSLFVIESQLRDIDMHLQASTLLVIDEIRNDCTRLLLAPGVVASINRCLDAGLLNVAHEYLTNPSASFREEFDSFPAIYRLNEFRQFAEGMTAKMNEPLNSRAVVDAISEGGKAAGLSFSSLSRTIAASSAIAYKAWHECTLREGELSERVLKELLSSLGLVVQEIKPLPRTGSTSGIKSFDVQINVSGNRETIPLPAYGSQSSGRYRILAIWDRLSEARMRRLLVDDKEQRPILLLFFGISPWTQRLELARAARRSFGEQQFLLLDETLFMFLLSKDDERTRSLFELSLAFSSSQPYSTTSGNVPREMFFGRSRDMQQLMDRNGPNLLYGGRQLGKTALLRQIQAVYDSSEDGRVVRYIDLHESGVGLYRPTSEIFATIAKRLKDVGYKEGKNTGEREVSNFILSWLATDERRRIVLLLDEADDFLKQDSFERFRVSKKLKALMDQTSRRFKIIFAGLHNVLRTTTQENHPLAHLGQPINIGPLMKNGEEVDALRLIREPLASLGFDMPVDISFSILAQTNYYPSLLQIYGKYLVETLYEEGQKNLTIPTRVSQQLVDEAYYSKPDLSESIRRNFRLTLQLDQRYEFLAYMMALSYVEKKLDLRVGMEFNEIMRKGLYWWPLAFSEMKVDELSALLDEMVGLGVLRRVDVSHYSFRTANVLQLMGSMAQIEEMVQKDRELKVEFDPAAFREKVSGKNDWSPFTEMQKKALCTRDHRVIVLTGSRALGLSQVKIAIESFGDTEVHELPSCNNETEFNSALARFITNINNIEGSHFLLVSHQLLWNPGWVAEALNRIEKRKTQVAFAKIVFIADPQRVFDLQNASMWARVKDLRAKFVSLERWEDSAVRQMIEDLGIDPDRKQRAKLKSITGYMPSLLRLYAQMKPSARNAYVDAASLFPGTAWPATYVEDTGMAVLPDAIMEFLSCLAITDDGDVETALGGMSIEINELDVDRSLLYFLEMSLVSKNGERYPVHPDIKAALGI